MPKDAENCCNSTQAQNLCSSRKLYRHPKQKTETADYPIQVRKKTQMCVAWLALLTYMQRETEVRWQRRTSTVPFQWRTARLETMPQSTLVLTYVSIPFFVFIGAIPFLPLAAAKDTSATLLLPPKACIFLKPFSECSQKLAESFLHINNSSNALSWDKGDVYKVVVQVHGGKKGRRCWMTIVTEREHQFSRQVQA